MEDCPVSWSSGNSDINIRQNSLWDLLDVCVGVPLRENVRVFLPEDVTNSAAGEDLQTAATLPHPERDLCTQHTYTRKHVTVPETITNLSHFCVFISITKSYNLDNPTIHSFSMPTYSVQVCWEVDPRECIFSKDFSRKYAVSALHQFPIVFFMIWRTRANTQSASSDAIDFSKEGGVTFAVLVSDFNPVRRAYVGNISPPPSLLPLSPPVHLKWLVRL